MCSSISALPSVASETPGGVRRDRQLASQRLHYLFQKSHTRPHEAAMHRRQPVPHFRMPHCKQLELQRQQSTSAGPAFCQEELAHRRELRLRIANLSISVPSVAMRVEISFSSNAKNRSSLLSKFA